MSKISAGTTTATGLVQTSDTTGNLELQTNNGTTAVTFDTSQNASFAGDISVQGGNYLSSQPSFRNIIINGDMRIAQRATSVANISSGGTYHTVDRFCTVLASAGTWTQTQSTDVPSGQGFSMSLKMQCTTASASLATGAYNSIQHYVEGQNLQHLEYGTSSAKTTTLSFWVKSNKTGTYVVQFLQPDAPTLRVIVKSYTISSADTWEKKTITIDADTAGTISDDYGNGLQIRFGLAFGSDYTSGTLQTSWGDYTGSDFAVGQVNLADSTSNYFNITGIQLEVGSQATPFERRPYDVELKRCERYYQKYINQTLSAYWTTGVMGIPFKTEMRSSPTVYWEYGGTPYRVYRIQDAVQTTLSGSSVPVSTTGMMYIYNSASTWAQSGSTITGVSVALLTFDAEI